MYKFTPQFLAKIENIFAQTPYILRYEKGTFQAGHCILKSEKIILINKFYSLEGKIQALLEILAQLELDTSVFDENTLQFYKNICKN